VGARVQAEVDGCYTMTGHCWLFKALRPWPSCSNTSLTGSVRSTSPTSFKGPDRGRERLLPHSLHWVRLYLLFLWLLFSVCRSFFWPCRFGPARRFCSALLQSDIRPSCSSTLLGPLQRSASPTSFRTPQIAGVKTSSHSYWVRLSVLVVPLGFRRGFVFRHYLSYLALQSTLLYVQIDIDIDLNPY
jgi:hypothetical protein